jgi:outer membrane protein assembly factor BamD (BamD/ComL family)
MGREPSGARKHVYLCLALLIFISSCSLLAESSRNREMRHLLTSGHNALARGDYDASLEAFEQVLEMARGLPPSDAAAYGLGLVHAHPQNPHRDRPRAIAAFNRVIANFPASLWTERAIIWVGVLNEAEASRLEIEKSRRIIEKSQLELEKTRLLVEESRQEIERTRTELEKSRQEIEKSKQIIEKSRQVDIEIEQKRRQRR